MATTTNYSWTTPDDTDLVKDGASAIRSLGTAIDTTVFNNASAAIAKSIVDAKGDIVAATAADTVSRLAVGANSTVLTADSSTATGLKWASGGLTLVQSGSLSNNTTFSFNNVFTSTYTNYKIMIKLSAVTDANDDLFMKLRASSTDSTTGLTSQRIAGNGTAASSSRNTENASNWLLGLCGSGNPTIATFTLDIFDPQVATRTTFQCLTISENASVLQNTYMAGFAANDTQYDGFTLTSTSNISGSYKIYGYGN